MRLEGGVRSRSGAAPGNPSRGRWVWAALLCWSVGLGPASSQKLSAPEYQIKAAFLYHLTKFCKWPGTAFEAPEAPLVIAVLGKDPFGSLLEETVAGRTAQGRPLLIRRFARLEDLGPCHLLFVSSSERKDLSRVFAALKTLPVLTVGDVPGLLLAGGMVNLVVRGDRVEFDIDAGQAERAGLQLSSQLLKLVKAGAR